jgi:hypothetical protein
LISNRLNPWTSIWARLSSVLAILRIRALHPTAAKSLFSSGRDFSFFLDTTRPMMRLRAMASSTSLMESPCMTTRGNTILGNRAASYRGKMGRAVGRFSAL